MRLSEGVLQDSPPCGLSRRRRQESSPVIACGLRQIKGFFAKVLAFLMKTKPGLQSRASFLRVGCVEAFCGVLA